MPFLDQQGIKRFYRFRQALYPKTGDQSDKYSQSAGDTAAKLQFPVFMAVPAFGPDRVDYKKQTVNYPSDIMKNTELCEIGHYHAYHKKSKAKIHLGLESKSGHINSPLIKDYEIIIA